MIKKEQGHKIQRKKNKVIMYKELTNRVVSIELKNKLKYNGILIDENLFWILLSYIDGDFLINGSIIIQKKFIKKIELIDDGNFKESIIRLLYKKDYGINNSNITSEMTLFDILNTLKIKNLLVSIVIKDSEALFLGKIIEVKNKSMKMRLLSTNCKWLNIAMFRFDEIRAIEINTLYIKGLSHYLDKEVSLKL